MIMMIAVVACREVTIDGLVVVVIMKMINVIGCR